MAEDSHYINNTEEEESTKLTGKVKKTPDSDLGKPLLDKPQVRQETVEEIRRLLENWVRKGDYWGQRTSEKSQGGSRSWN